MHSVARRTVTDTSPIGSMAWVNSVSSASIMIGGVIEPVMMTSPADSFSPKAASVLATCATMSASLPVRASGSVVVAASLPRRIRREVRPAVAAAGARVAAQDDVALVDVACEHGVEIVRRRRWIEIGELDGREDVLDRRQRRRRGRSAAAADRAPCARRFPARPPAWSSRRTTPCCRTASSARCIRKPTSGAVSPSLLHGRPARRGRPSSRAASRRAAMRARRLASCAVMPFLMQRIVEVGQRKGHLWLSGCTS